MKNFIFNECLGALLIPKKIKKNLKAELELLKVNRVPYSLVAYLFYFILFISSLTSFLIFKSLFIESPMEIRLLFLFTLIIIITYVIWKHGVFTIYKIIYNNTYDTRIRNIERKLPDFLIELNINLRSGVIFHRALEESLNPEHGDLNIIIQDVLRQIKLGKETKDALLSVTGEYNSLKIKEVFNLLAKSTDDGGKTIALIDNLVYNLNTSFYLRDETEASVGQYAMFISAIAVLISPFLFAVSYYFLEILREVIAKIISQGLKDVLFSGINELSIDPGYFLMFTQAGAIISGLSAAYIITLMKEGKNNYKHYLTYFIISVSVFWGAYYILGFFFNSFSI